MERQQRFSIRKFKTAVGSALLATLFLGMPVLQAVNVLAETQAQELTVQQDLNNATNLIDAQQLKSELAQAFEAKAGTSTGELLHDVPSQALDEAIQKAEAAGVKVTSDQTVKYDSLEAAQADYAGQLENLEAVIAKQEAATKAFQEAVTSYKLYQEAQDKYEADKSLYDAYLATKADYDKAFEAYQVAFEAYEKELANNVKLLADYELAKAEYTKAYSLYQDKLAKYTDTTKGNEAKKAAYETALEQYKKDYAAYEKALAAHRTATETDAAKQAEYEKELAQYNKENEQYQKDLAAYKTALAEAEKNTGNDGYLSQALAQNLIFEREPNATVTISGQKANLAPSLSELPNSPERINTDVKWLTPGDYRTTPQLTTFDNVKESYFVLLGYGETTTVRYDNLQNSSYNGRKISSVIYKYTPEATNRNQDVAAFISTDPTLTFVGGSDYQPGQDNEFRMGLEVEFYYDNGQKVVFDKNSSALIALTSLNSYDNFKHTEQVTNYEQTAEFIKITGSSIGERDGAIKAIEDNYPTRLDWDRADSPNLYYGSGALRIKGGDRIKLTFGSNSDARIWFAFNSKIATTSKLPQTPTPPTKPTPPKSTVTGNEPQKPTPPVEPTYEQAEKPTPPVEPTKPLITEPQKPTEPTPPGIVPPPPGEPTPVPIPKEPEALSVTVHKATYAVTSKPTKGVTNEAGEDVSNGLIPKGSVVKFPISLPSLKAGRKPTENHVIHDYVDEGVEMNLEAIKAAYPGYDVTFSEEDRLLTLTATEVYVAEMNKDLSKDFDFVTPDLVGRVLNDGATYTNTIRWVWNDYDSFSDTVKVSTPGKTPDPDHPTNNLIEPTKTVTNLEGQNIDGQAILATDQLVYPNLWDLDQFATIKNGDKTKQIHIYIEDIDGTKATPDLENLTFIDKAKETVKTPLKATYVEGLDKADQALKELIVAAGLDDDIQGDFVAIVPEYMAAFEELHVKTGNSISFDLKMTPKEGATGEIKNTSYQIAYGNGYKTKTTTNTIQVTTEWEDKTTKEPLKDMVTGDKTEERGDFPRYRFVETVNTKTGIKHIFERLYTTEWEENGTGRVLKDKVTDIDTKEKGDIPGMTFVKTVETETGIKHIFKKAPETPKETKTPPAKTPGNPSKGSLPSTGDSTSLLVYLGMGLLSILVAWKLRLIKKIKTIFSR